jgi:hypothetical protein
MTGEQKLAYLEQQVTEIRMGLLTFMTCPYCGKENTPADERLCCALFGEATTAILDRLEKQQAIDFLNTIADRVH